MFYFLLSDFLLLLLQLELTLVVGKLKQKKNQNKTNQYQGGFTVLVLNAPCSLFICF